MRVRSQTQARRKLKTRASETKTRASKTRPSSETKTCASETKLYASETNICAAETKTPPTKKFNGILLLSSGGIQTAPPREIAFHLSPGGIKSATPFDGSMGYYLPLIFKVDQIRHLLWPMRPMGNCLPLILPALTLKTTDNWNIPTLKRRMAALYGFSLNYQYVHIAIWQHSWGELHSACLYGTFARQCLQRGYFWPWVLHLSLDSQTLIRGLQDWLKLTWSLQWISCS